MRSLWLGLAELLIVAGAGAWGVRKMRRTAGDGFRGQFSHAGGNQALRAARGEMSDGHVNVLGRLDLAAEICHLGEPQKIAQVMWPVTGWGGVGRADAGQQSLR